MQMKFGEQQPVPTASTSVSLLRTEDFEQANLSQLVSRPALTIFLYRTDFNKAMRAAWASVGSYTRRSQLALDLHFLLTAWGDSAEDEYAILGRALQIIEDTPILSGPLLVGATDWAASECVQLVMEEIEIETLIRIFDSLPVDYRLSAPYIARVVRIEGVQEQTEPPVITAIGGIKSNRDGL
jgi:hypothetical protein